MSGFEGKTGWFGLTPTKALYWHRYRECGCRYLVDIVEAHLVDAGFTVEDKGTWARVTGPGLVDGSTSELYLAISGADPDRARPTSEHRWSR